VIQLAKDMENVGVDMLELNVGSPVGVVQPASDSDRDPANAFKKKAFATQLEQAQELVRSIRAAVRIPLTTKLTFYGIDLPSASMAMKAAGTHGLTIANRMKGLEIDLETGRPLWGGGFCGISGPWTRPLVLGGVAIVARETGLPIMSGSGAYMWQDVVKLMMCGASLVQVVTPITHGPRGYKVVGDWLKRLDGFLNENGHKSVTEIVGKTLPQIRAWDTLVRIPRGEIWAEIVQEKCNQCLLCLNWCFYDALSVSNGRPVLSKERCAGCANCITLCPKGAIVMKGEHPIYIGDGL
jgi:dihydroorotate dehydrogenase (fumarate)/dihydropyrimidine dehydrogenase (NAD+) subunit PreA